MSVSFRNVLFASLNDEPTPPPLFDHVVELARLMDASLSLIDAIPPVNTIQRRLRYDDTRNIHALANDARREQLRHWTDDVDFDRKISVRVVVGRRTPEIAKIVEAAGHDLVIVAPTPGIDNLGIVHRLIRTVPCPLLVLKNPILTGNVIAAVDPNDDDALNTAILRSAAGVATLTDHTVHLLHAYEPHGTRALRGISRTTITDAHIDDYVDQVRTAHHDALTHLADRIGLDDAVTQHVEVGSPLHVCARAAIEYEASLVVVGAGGHPTMPAVLIGKTAERIVSNTAISTLVVKTPGFISAFDDHDTRRHHSAAAQHSR